MTRVKTSLTLTTCIVYYKGVNLDVFVLLCFCISFFEMIHIIRGLMLVVSHDYL